MIGHKLLRIAFWVAFGGVPIVGLLLGALWTVVDGIKGRDDEFPGSWRPQLGGDKPRDSEQAIRLLAVCKKEDFDISE